MLRDYDSWASRFWLSLVNLVPLCWLVVVPWFLLRTSFFVKCKYLSRTSKTKKCISFPNYTTIIALPKSQFNWKYLLWFIDPWFQTALKRFWILHFYKVIMCEFITPIINNKYLYHLYMECLSTTPYSGKINIENPPSLIS